MTTIQIVVLAIVQGLTEFLPISSSGHLVLVPYLVDWTDQGLAFDVAVHFGSLLAVVIFFRKDIAGLLRGGLQLIGGDRQAPQAYMALADRYARRTRGLTEVRIRDALIIGTAQALALVPGTSRSGVTITAARMLGFERQDAARFSFLLSAPVILLATVYKGGEMVFGESAVAWGELGLGVVVSAIVAYLSIEFFMRVVTRIGLAPFAIYRLALAGVLIYVLA